MAFWWKKKSQAVEFQQWDLPGNVGTISLPGFLTVEFEDDDTLMAYRDNDLTLRISRISFTKPGQPSEDLAKEYLRQQAKEKQRRYYESGENAVISFEERVEENGTPLDISYWQVGAKCTILTISATVMANQPKTPANREIFELLPRIIESAKITVIHKLITLEDHEVAVSEQIVDKTKQEITTFGPEENAWLEEGRSLAASLNLKYGSGGDLTPADLDVVLSRWMEDDEEKEPANSVADGLGAAFGDFLVENHQFRWVVVTDEYGTDYAVRHQHSEVMAFPTSSVAKRIDDREPECFVILFEMLQDVLGRYKKEDSID